MNQALLFSVFIVASCGLAYELIAGALASYVLGDSVTQFSTVIGTYLFAMGVGSWLSRFVERNLIARFVQVELMVGVLGGLSAAGLFFIFVWFTTVSYTHLDVYKRQRQHFAHRRFRHRTQAVEGATDAQAIILPRTQGFDQAQERIHTVAETLLARIQRAPVKTAGQVQHRQQGHADAGIACGGNQRPRHRGRIGIGAVSYTHLDVYKRQDHHGIVHNSMRDEEAGGFRVADLQALSLIHI